MFEMKGTVHIHALSVDSDVRGKSVIELILTCEQKNCTQAGPSGWNDAVIDVKQTTSSK